MANCIEKVLKFQCIEELSEEIIYDVTNDEDIDIRVSNISILSNYLKYKYNFTLNYYIKKIKKIPIKGTITSIKLEFLIEIINSHSGRGSIRSGTGLANIKAVAEKYHGAMEVRIDGDIFVLSVLLIIPQQSESISQQIC